MSIKRRTLRGAPLLVASAGAAMAVGCDGITTGTTSGNLVAPPPVELCVEVSPEEATVTLDGQAFDTEAGCQEVWEGSHTLAADAEGYAPYTETFDLWEDTTKSIALEEEAGGDEAGGDESGETTGGGG